MIQRGLLPFAFALLLSSCGPHMTTSSTPNLPLKPKNLKPLPVPSHDYVLTKDLVVLNTQSEVSESSNNSLRLEGVGTLSTYKAQYRFNSGSNQELRLLAAQSTSQNCAAISWKYSIQTNSTEQNIDMLHNIPLSANTDYILEVSLADHQCPEVSVDLGVLVWAGAAQEQPTQAFVCEGEKSGTVDFLLSEFHGEAFTHRPGQEKFLANNIYCGQELSAPANQECTTNLPRDGRTAVTSCQSRSEVQAYSSRVDYDLISHTAQVRCQINSDESYFEHFANCRHVIINKAPYIGL